MRVDARHAAVAGSLASLAALAAAAVLAFDLVAPVPPPDRYTLLERQVRDEPDDGRARVLKARMDVAAGRHDAAAAGFAQALARDAKVARDAAVWVELAEAVAMSQGDRLAGEPERLLERALGLDASNARALDLAGSAAWERGDFVRAAGYWERLEALLPPSDPRRAALSAALEKARQRARLTLPP
ncbi:MAG: hypothetical protein HY854_09020 [Burkholderiales bacterium]|nr:hypothetical protein [Burkholderiales bacterium]